MAVSTRARLRKFWFQAHLWLGVGLALALVPICVTGAYEVWHEEIDRLINAPRYATTDGEPRPADAADEAFGDRATVNAVRMPQHPGDPVIVTGNANVEPAKPVLAGDTALRWKRRIHDGSDMGVIWRIIITLAGLIPAGLAVTGVIVWALRQGGKARNRAATA